MLMHRLLAVPCLLALFLVAGARADEKDSKVGKAKDSKAANPDALFQELVKKFQTSKPGAERQKLFDEYAEKFVDIASKNTKSVEGFKAATHALRIPGGTGKDGHRAKAIAVLNKNYTKAKLGKRSRSGCRSRGTTRN